jgi:hypothetical protein
MNKNEFMNKVSDNALGTFEAVLALNGKGGLEVEWGSVGFSLKTRVGNQKIPVCWGFNKVSKNGEVIEFKFSKMRDVLDYDVMADKYRKTLLNLDFTEQFLMVKEVKVIFEQKLNEERINNLIAVIKDLAKEIQKNGLGPN